VRPIAIRDEDPPHDEVIVLRGGLLLRESVGRAARKCLEEHGFLGVSVYGAVQMTVDDLVASVDALGPDRYRQVRLSNFGALRRAGFPLWPSNLFPHFSIVLPDLDPATLSRLEGCFAPPILNPALSRGRGQATMET
jgi:hypothetical protein